MITKERLIGGFLISMMMQIFSAHMAGYLLPLDEFKLEELLNSNHAFYARRGRSSMKEAYYLACEDC